MRAGEGETAVANDFDHAGGLGGSCLPLSGGIACGGGREVRALSAQEYASGNMTLESCATFCYGFRYFGTECAGGVLLW